MNMSCTFNETKWLFKTAYPFAAGLKKMKEKRRIIFLYIQVWNKKEYMSQMMTVICSVIGSSGSKPNVQPQSITTISTTDKELQTIYSAAIRGICRHWHLSAGVRIPPNFVWRKDTVRRGRLVYYRPGAPFWQPAHSRANVEVRAGVATLQLTYDKKELYAQKVISEFDLTDSQQPADSESLSWLRVEAQQVRRQPLTSQQNWQMEMVGVSWGSLSRQFAQTTPP